VLDQRCLFHKLRNVADKARSELKGEEKRDERKQLLEQASTIYQAESAAQARERLTPWAEDWRERAPKAVSTLERDFEQTLVYYSLESVARAWIRTTSLLERTNRHLRRKFRQAVLAVARGLRWPSISKSNGSMRIGRMSGGRKPPTRSILIFGISTLSQGYNTFIFCLLNLFDFVRKLYNRKVQS